MPLHHGLLCGDASRRPNGTGTNLVYVTTKYADMITFSLSVLNVEVEPLHCARPSEVLRGWDPRAN